MATTAIEAWRELRATGQKISNGFDGFVAGFQAGWKAQENRPFHCTFCGVEIIGETDGETILRAQDHTRACDVHPLAIEIRRLRDALAPFADRAVAGWDRSGAQSRTIAVSQRDIVRAWEIVNGVTD